MEDFRMRIWKRNQIIITALVIMVGIAGYLNFADQSASETLNWDEVEQTTKKENIKQQSKSKETEVEDVIEEEKMVNNEEVEEQDDENVGEAVLTSADGSDMFYSIKLAREQTRAENKEMLNEIINNANSTEKQKNEAIDSIMDMTEIAEKENAAETLLNAKGFSEAVVSLDGEKVDVVINQHSLTDEEIVQIQDIVKRKTEVSLENVVISTTMENENN